MFNQTFVEEGGHTRKPYTVGLSLLLQMALLCLLALAPLIYQQGLPGAQLKSILAAPPAPPRTTPKVLTKPLPVVTKRSFNSARMIAPVVIPKQLPTFNDAPAAPNLGTSDLPGVGSDAGTPLLLYGSEAAPKPAPPPVAASEGKPKTMRVGGRVAEANLIHRIQPLYPPLAKSARVQGTVEFTAIISQDGRVEHLQLVRGHSLLVNAARDAILQWRYQPTLLNGKPTEVITQITVNFTLAP